MKFRLEIVNLAIVTALVMAALAPSLYWMQNGVLPFWLLAEGGVFEHGSALASFIAALVFFLTSRQTAGWRKSWCRVLALGCLFIGAEEVSWGQHLFGFTPPAAFRDANFQGELNLHNLRAIQSSNNAVSSWLFRALMVYMMVLPIAANVFPSIARGLGRVKFPIPSLAIALTGLLVKAADLLNHEVIYGASFSRDSLRVGETVESLFQVLLLWLAVELWLESRGGG